LSEQTPSAITESLEHAVPVGARWPRVDVALIVLYFLSGPALLALSELFGITVAGRGPLSVRTAIIYGLASPVIGVLAARRHPRARFAIYVFSTMEILRCLRGPHPLTVLVPIALLVYLQTPWMRAYFPRLTAATVWARLRSRFGGRAAPRVSSEAPDEPPPESEPQRFAPSLVSWNVTSACDLRCPHCYLDAGAKAEGELTTERALELIDEFARMGTEMLILTGGEPLLREDLPELIEAASGAGIHVVLGTNGRLLDTARARDLREAGLSGVGISIDSLDPARHDAFRGREGSLDRALAALDACREQGLPVVMQSSVFEWNREELPELVQLARDRGAAAFNAYFLVCTGRGEQLTDLAPADYEQSLRWLGEQEVVHRGEMMVRAKCAPHAARIACEAGAPLGGSAGCLAGKSYVRIGPRGEVTACPYMPDAVGNVLDEGFEVLWTSAPLFARLREGRLGGRCGRCEHQDVCGGCRARALATSGDPLGEDPFCTYEPKGGERPAEFAVLWTPEARARLARVPAFIRARLEAGLEAHARARGLPAVTPELMAEVRRRAAWPPPGSRTEPPFASRVATGGVGAGPTPAHARDLRRAVTDV